VGNDGVDRWDVLGFLPTLDGECPPVPLFDEEGEECYVDSAKLTKLGLRANIWSRVDTIGGGHTSKRWSDREKSVGTGHYSWVASEAWVDWKINGQYIGPKWRYSTCLRCQQAHADCRSCGYLDWCDDHNCAFRACNPQLVDLDFYYLSCECERGADGTETGRKVWEKKHWHDQITIRGENRSLTPNWLPSWHWWVVEGGPPFEVDKNGFPIWE